MAVRKGTVILVWPMCRDYETSVGEVDDYVCHALENCLPGTASTRDRELADTLIAWCEKHNKDDIEREEDFDMDDYLDEESKDKCKRDIEARLKTAVVYLSDLIIRRWGDADLFLKLAIASDVPRKMERMGLDMLISAYHCFHWEKMKGL